MELPVMALIISGDRIMSTNVKYSCSSLQYQVITRYLLLEFLAHSIDVDTLAELEEGLGAGYLEDKDAVAADDKHPPDYLAYNENN